MVREDESGFLPPLKTRIDSFEKYDVIFVGFPTWDMKMPPMKSFLKKMEGFSIKGGIERDGVLFVMEGTIAANAENEVRKWLHKIKVR